MASPTAFALVHFTVDKTDEVVSIGCVKNFNERNACGSLVNHRLNKTKNYKVKWQNQCYHATLHDVGDMGESVFLHNYIYIIT